MIKSFSLVNAVNDKMKVSITNIKYASEAGIVNEIKAILSKCQACNGVFTLYYTRL